MTLVYRSSKQQPVKPLHELGPGSYDLVPKNNKKSGSTPKSSVFASSSARDPFDIKKYKKETEQTLKSLAKKFEVQQSEPPSDIEQDSSCLFKQKKTTDCSHVFNSKVERFAEQKSSTQEQLKQIQLAQQFKKLLMKDITTHVKGKLLKAKDKLEKQKQLDENYQIFPSIPNWSNSFGYRYDSDANKWISNENPNLMEMMLEKQKANHRANQALGPGCYVYNPKKQNSKQKDTHTVSPTKSPDMISSFTCPNIKPETPIHNSIQEIQNKKKLRIRLIGQSQITKVQEIISSNENPLLYQDTNLEGKNAKQILLLNQMYKKFKNFIPKHQQKSPTKFFEKIQEKREALLHKESEPLRLSDITNNHNHQHFLAKSHRFNIEKKQVQKQKPNFINNQQTADQTANSSILDNSALCRKSHNCKEPYSLGEDRFKENKSKETLGPGAYFSQNIPNTKLPPCLNLKEERFHHKNQISHIPGPGQYNVAQELLKKQNNLSDAFSYYKKTNNGEIKKNFKRQDSMETLYQTWGRQMNYVVKMENQSRPQNKQEKQEKQNKERQSLNEEKSSLTKTRKQLETSLRKFDTTLSSVKTKQPNGFTNERIIETVQVRSISEHKQGKNPVKVYPKITKHLYEYKEQPNKDQSKNLGPGLYETRKDMVKKTFNVTYT